MALERYQVKGVWFIVSRYGLFFSFVSFRRGIRYSPVGYK